LVYNIPCESGEEVHMLTSIGKEKFLPWLAVGAFQGNNVNVLIL